MESNRVEIVGYVETREVRKVGNDLIPSEEIKYAFSVKFPNGTTESIKTDKDSVDRYIKGLGLPVPGGSSADCPVPFTNG
jgi:hypothetical protein